MHRVGWAVLGAIGAGLMLQGWSTAVAGPAWSGPRLVCKVFEADLTDEAGFDSSDAGHPIGAWVTEMEARGWGLHQVQLAVGQKHTGFPQGYQQVCVTPR